MGATAKNVVQESSNSSYVGFSTKKPVASVPASRAQHPSSSPAHGTNRPVTPLSQEVREAFVDARVAGEFVQFHWRTVQRFARQNIIPAHPLGSGPRKTWRFLLSELDEWMRSQKNDACK